VIITIIRREPGSRSGLINTKLNLGSLEGGVYSLRQMFYCILNVLLFVPWGLMIKLLRGKDCLLRNYVMTVLICFSTSFFIEITQLITGRGRFEITDILMNVIGGAIGALLGVAYHSFNAVREVLNETV